MGCRVITVAGGAVIACGRDRRQPCSTTGCRGRGIALCDFKLVGRKEGQTCDRSLCAKCRKVQGESEGGDSVDYCPTHDAITKLEAGRRGEARG